MLGCWFDVVISGPPYVHCIFTLFIGFSFLDFLFVTYYVVTQLNLVIKLKSKFSTLTSDDDQYHLLKSHFYDSITHKQNIF